MGLAENIRRLRRKKQMSQPALAQKAGLSKGYIYVLETGEMDNPTLDVLHKIATALDTTVAELIDEPSVAATESRPDIPDTLLKFAKMREKAGDPLNEEDIENLARIEFRGDRPETVDDWAYVYEFFRRSFVKGKRKK